MAGGDPQGHDPPWPSPSVSAWVVVLVFREVWKDGIVIEPVIVQLPDLKGAPTSDLASQQIAKHIDFIQKAGVGEWRKLYVDRGFQPDRPAGAGRTAPPCAPACASSPPCSASHGRPSVPRSSCGASRGLRRLGQHGWRDGCTRHLRAADTPGGIDEILECIALSAIGFIDPKVAASYVFSTEQRNCNNLDATVPPIRPVPRARKRAHKEPARALLLREDAGGDRPHPRARGRPEDLPSRCPMCSGGFTWRALPLWPASIARGSLPSSTEAIGRFGRIVAPHAGFAHRPSCADRRLCSQGRCRCTKPPPPCRGRTSAILRCSSSSTCRIRRLPKLFFFFTGGGKLNTSSWLRGSERGTAHHGTLVCRRLEGEPADPTGF